MQTTVRELEVTLEELKAKVKLAELLDTLHRSPAFKTIIEKGLFQDRAQQLVKMTCQANLNELQTKIHSHGCIMISGLQGYFGSIYVEANQAKIDIEAYEQALEDSANEQERA